MRAPGFVGLVGMMAVAATLGLASGGAGVAWASPSDSVESIDVPDAGPHGPSASGVPGQRAREGRLARSASPKVSLRRDTPLQRDLRPVTPSVPGVTTRVRVALAPVGKPAVSIAIASGHPVRQPAV